jgi:hypothetical protein
MNLQNFKASKRFLRLNKFIIKNSIIIIYFLIIIFYFLNYYYQSQIGLRCYQIFNFIIRYSSKNKSIS